MLDALYESISKLKLKFDTPILRREPSLMYDTQRILVIISHFVYDLFFFRVLYQRKENLPTQCATLSTTAHCRSFSSHCFCISSLHTSGRLSVSDQLKRGQLQRPRMSKTFKRLKHESHTFTGGRVVHFGAFLSHSFAFLLHLRVTLFLIGV